MKDGLPGGRELEQLLGNGVRWATLAPSDGDCARAVRDGSSVIMWGPTSLEHVRPRSDAASVPHDHIAWRFNTHHAGHTDRGHCFRLNCSARSSATVNDPTSTNQTLTGLSPKAHCTRCVLRSIIMSIRAKCA